MVDPRRPSPPPPARSIEERRRPANPAALEHRSTEHTEFVRRHANGLHVDRQYRWRTSGPYGSSRRVAGLHGRPMPTAKEAGRDLLKDFEAEAPVCDLPRHELAKIADVKLRGLRSHADQYQRNLASQWQVMILEAERFIREKFDEVTPRRPLDRLSYALPAPLYGSTCSFIRDEPAGTCTEMLLPPRCAKWSPGTYSDMPKASKHIELCNAKYGPQEFTGKHYMVSIDKRAVVEPFDGRGVLLIDDDGVMLSARNPRNMGMSELGLHQYCRLSTRALDLFEDVGRGEQRVGTRRAFLTLGLKLDTTSQCAMLRKAGDTKRQQIECMQNIKGMQSLFKKEYFDKIETKVGMAPIFSVEGCLVDLFNREHKLQTANWCEGANGASSGYFFINRDHDDEDCGLTSLLCGRGDLAAGGHFGHGRRAPPPSPPTSTLAISLPAEPTTFSQTGSGTSW